MLTRNSQRSECEEAFKHVAVANLLQSAGGKKKHNERSKSVNASYNASVYNT